jgi:hypothetical protein
MAAAVTPTGPLRIHRLPTGSPDSRSETPPPWFGLKVVISRMCIFTETGVATASRPLTCVSGRGCSACPGYAVSSTLPIPATESFRAGPLTRAIAAFPAAGWLSAAPGVQERAPDLTAGCRHERAGACGTIPDARRGESEDTGKDRDRATPADDSPEDAPSSRSTSTRTRRLHARAPSAAETPPDRLWVVFRPLRG